MSGVTDDEPLSLSDLEREVATLWDAYQGSHYGTLARRRPYLIDDCLS